MFHEFFAERGDLLVLPLVALGIFFVTFVLVVAHVLRGGRRQDRWNHVASLPLDEEPRVGFDSQRGGVRS